jgi:hypothetical protein
MAGSITVSSITLDSDNNFSIKSNTGATILSANGTGLITGIASGSAITNAQLTTPTVSGNLSFDSTGTTGVRVPSANTLTFHTTGTEDMRITSDGKVGVGTSSPGDRLHVYENTSYVGIKLQNQTSFMTSFVHDGLGGHGFIYKSGALDTAFYNNDVETMRVKSGGAFQFNSGYGSVATAYGCRAWVNFNGQGTVAIRASGNVTSITDNATGQYTVNFTTSMPDANYAVAATMNGESGTGSGSFDGNGVWGANSRAVGSVRVEFYSVGTGYKDSSLCDVAIFR